MEATNNTYKVRLGIFIIVGIILFFLAIFIIGKQKNLFDPVFTLKSNFRNVSGLQVGNTVRFSGINVGTVDNISIINDSTVRVSMLIKKDVQKFIKADSEAGIGSEGIIGDKVMVLSQGSYNSPMVKENQMIASSEPVETDAIMQSLAVTADNAAIATEEISDILIKINKGEGTLGRLIQDKQMAENIDATLSNLKRSSKGLEENMEAAKHNFLLRGYFRKKEKAKKEAEEKQKEAVEKANKKAKASAEKSKTKSSK
ncbi:MAG: organic solvent ABC transporter substrate-binding protein [Flavobacterium sp. BFFFF1]|uniref:MlaD family protein n=1 Tax=unclassified Flavobacterium TaxID=196869 RepID=UPI000BD0A8EE|nr:MULTISPECIES: MlaD family protein [unclassified Flavobacterium]OYU81195.1 MAG: organic solvent ABC transporter substrate-binding protein [Flavobacterium sp. BFFFF1]